METFERLEAELLDALTHLHDCEYRPPALLCTVTDCDPQNRTVSVQSVIIQAIADLAPHAAIPPGAHARQVYDALYHRYVLKLTLEATAERLNMSVRHLTRKQRAAVHALARSLWELSLGRGQLIGSSAILGKQEEEPLQDAIAGTQVDDWSSQVRRELASLASSAPGVTSDVAQVINDVIELEGALTAAGRLRVEAESVPSNLTAAIHPSALRQMLITALRRLARYTSGEPIIVYARLEGGNTRISLTGKLAAGCRPDPEELMQQVLVPDEASIEACVDNDRIFLWMQLPSEGKRTVLVIDDNPDMAHFYRRAAEGTRYHIVHVARGQEALATVEALAPDIVVLDVMLPDVDGWRVLMHLHENVATRSTPVVVCSVVREENLALDLGATLYLPKPIRPQQFIQALDTILPQA